MHLKPFIGVEALMEAVEKRQHFIFKSQSADGNRPHIQQVFEAIWHGYLLVTKNTIKDNILRSWLAD